MTKKKKTNNSLLKFRLKSLKFENFKYFKVLKVIKRFEYIRP